ncbi:Exosome complex component RRP45 [Portunus trituberculatus]|uniref:Exosome complex component RRP45 n=1 Tax=Portunus trituberculatus TaxID=210409 RepID=A0A5B7E1L9_PORTR|nr:Exosome complex component RRP45 [Portunus trituberculatus]
MAAPNFGWSSRIMREVPLSTCERTSLVSSIYAGLRYDHRKFMEVRDITLNFGKDYGSCTATLGETRVLAQRRTGLGQQNINEKAHSVASLLIKPIELA